MTSQLGPVSPFLDRLLAVARHACRKYVLWGVVAWLNCRRNAKSALTSAERRHRLNEQRRRLRRGENEILLAESNLAVNDYFIAWTERNRAVVCDGIKCRYVEFAEILDVSLAPLPSILLLVGTGARAGASH